MEQEKLSDAAGSNGNLLCRQELDATCKKLNTQSNKNKSKPPNRYSNTSANSKSRSNLSHPKIPPPPPPGKHLASSINYVLRQNNIGGISPHNLTSQVSTTATLNNKAFIEIGQQESQKDFESISLPIEPHQRQHLGNSQYVINTTSSSSSSLTVKSPSFGFDGISQGDYENSISKTSFKDDQRRLVNNTPSSFPFSG